MAVVATGSVVAMVVRSLFVVVRLDVEPVNVSFVLTFFEMVLFWTLLLVDLIWVVLVVLLEVFLLVRFLLVDVPNDVPFVVVPFQWVLFL